MMQHNNLTCAVTVSGNISHNLSSKSSSSCCVTLESSIVFRYLAPISHNSHCTESLVPENNGTYPVKKNIFVMSNNSSRIRPFN